MANGVGLQVLERAAEIIQQQLRKITADAVTNQDLLDDGGFAFGWQWVGRDQPATQTDPFGQVVQREAVVVAVAVRQLVADGRQRALAVTSSSGPSLVIPVPSHCAVSA